MIEINEQCKKCFHFPVCANVMKNQLYIREKMLKEKNPKCEHFAPDLLCSITEKSYIDYNALYEALNNLSKWEHGEYNRAINDCMNVLDNFPKAKAKDIMDCKECEYFGKLDSENPCRTCRNSYEDKFQAISEGDLK